MTSSVFGAKETQPLFDLPAFGIETVGSDRGSIH